MSDIKDKFDKLTSDEKDEIRYFYTKILSHSIDEHKNGRFCNMNNDNFIEFVLEPIKSILMLYR